MSNRRGFLKQVTTGLMALGLGARDLLAQLRLGHMMESPPGPETIIDGKRYLYFGGTGYYGFQGNPVLLKAACQALQKYGMHPSTSRSGFGNSPLYEAVEKKAAEYFGTESSCYIASGYLCNTAGFQALAAMGRCDVVFMDEGSHYSIVDYVSLTGKPVVRFAHADPEDLRRKLPAELKAGQKPLVVSDGVFPTFGQIAPVPEYVKAIEDYEGSVWLDDNHGVGVLGPNGRGTYDHYGLKSDRLFFGGTMSKAFGSHGGIVPGPKGLIDAIVQSHIMEGATDPTSAAAAASIAGMDILMKHPELRTRLLDNARRLKEGLRRIGFPVGDTPFPVAAWKLKSAEEMDRVHQGLMDRGICIQRTHYVGAGIEGVLRVVVFSTHTAEQIDRLLAELRALA
jgi:7-keto-8-aminopelargonate synthetase-like enzyme